MWIKIENGEWEKSLMIGLSGPTLLSLIAGKGICGAGTNSLTLTMTCHSFVNTCTCYRSGFHYWWLPMIGPGLAMGERVITEASVTWNPRAKRRRCSNFSPPPHHSFVDTCNYYKSGFHYQWLLHVVKGPVLSLGQGHTVTKSSASWNFRRDGVFKRRHGSSPPPSFVNTYTY